MFGRIYGPTNLVTSASEHIVTSHSLYTLNQENVHTYILQSSDSKSMKLILSSYHSVSINYINLSIIYGSIITNFYIVH